MCLVGGEALPLITLITEEIKKSKLICSILALDVIHCNESQKPLKIALDIFSQCGNVCGYMWDKRPFMSASWDLWVGCQIWDFSVEKWVCFLPWKVSVLPSMKNKCIPFFLCWQLTPDQELPLPSSRSLSNSPPFTHSSLSCPSCGKTPSPWPRTPSSLGESRQSRLQGWLWMRGKDHEQHNTHGLAHSQGTQGSPADSWGIHLYLHLDNHCNTQPHYSLPTLDPGTKCTLGDWFLRNVTLDPW